MNKIAVVKELAAVAKELVGVKFDTKKELEEYRHEHGQRPGTKLEVRTEREMQERYRSKKAIMKGLLKIAKEVIAAAWGFDSTDFDKPARFVKVLSAVGISSSQEPKRGHIGEFIWKGSGITIVTGNNPITGEYMRPNLKDSEQGYASAIGIEGDPNKVALAVEAVKRNATYIKGQSEGEREFI